MYGSNGQCDIGSLNLQSESEEATAHANPEWERQCWESSMIKTRVPKVVYKINHMDWEFLMYQLLVSEISVCESVMKNFEHHPKYTAHREIVWEHAEWRNLASLITTTRNGLWSRASICTIEISERSRWMDGWNLPPTLPLAVPIQCSRHTAPRGIYRWSSSKNGAT